MKMSYFKLIAAKPLKRRHSEESDEIVDHDRISSEAINHIKEVGTDLSVLENAKGLDRASICLNRGKIHNEQLPLTTSTLSTLLKKWINHLELLQNEDTESSDEESPDDPRQFSPIASNVEHDYSNSISALKGLLTQLPAVIETLSRTPSPKPESEGKAAQDRLACLVSVWDEMETALSSTSLFKKLTVQILLFNTSLDSYPATAESHEDFLGNNASHPEVIQTINELVQRVI